MCACWKASTRVLTKTPALRSRNGASVLAPGTAFPWTWKQWCAFPSALPKAPSESPHSSGRSEALNRFIDTRMNADLVIRLLCHLLQGKVARIHVRNPALPHHDAVEQPLPQRHH